VKAHHARGSSQTPWWTANQIRMAATRGAPTRALTQPVDNVYTFTNPADEVKVRLTVGILFAAGEERR
jgi:hypothetical protein